jgi:hypothetical protein
MGNAQDLGDLQRSVEVVPHFDLRPQRTLDITSGVVEVPEIS